MSSPAGVRDDLTVEGIAGQPAAVARVLKRLLPGIVDGALWTGLGLSDPTRVRLVASAGSSLCAARVTAGVFEVLAGVSTDVVVASRQDRRPTGADSGRVLTIGVSPSGETPEVLEALDESGGPVLAVTDRPRSSLAQRSDALLLTGSGPEVGPAAATTVLPQVVAGVALALSCAAATGFSTSQAIARHGLQLGCVPGRLVEAHTVSLPVAVALSAELAGSTSVVLLSCGTGRPYAAEGAREFAALTGRHVEVLCAEELGREALALVGTGTPVLVIESGPGPQLACATHLLAARGARLIRVGSAPLDTFPVLTRRAPAWGPIESVLAVQLLARCTAVVLGRDVDEPRDLALCVSEP